jgi:DASS family divalent anion:Na+ symporter
MVLWQGGETVKFDVKKSIGVILAFIVLFAFFLMPPFPGLTHAGMMGIGLFAWAVIMMSFQVIPDHIIFLIYACAVALSGVLKFKDSFSSFAGDSWWTVLGALSIGVAASETGLLKRISLKIMSWLPHSYPGQVAAQLIAGYFTTPLIPSGIIRSTIIGPVTAEITETMGIPKGSKAAAGMFAAFYLGTVGFTCAFINGSSTGYLIDSYIEAKFKLSYLGWVAGALPWAIVTMGIVFIAIAMFFKPADARFLPKSYYDEKRAEMGPMSKKEKIAAVIMAATLALWMTEPFHRISAALVAVISMSAYLITNCIGNEAFRSKMNWQLMIFYGCILNFGTVCSVHGIDKWLSAALKPVVMPFAGNPYMFAIVLSLAVYIVRFMFCSWVAPVTILGMVFIPLGPSVGIHPWVVGMMVFTCIDIFVLRYQNFPYITSYAATNDMANHKDVFPLALLRAGTGILGTLISIPIWQMLGLIWKV